MDILNFGQLLVETRYGSQFNVPLYYIVEKGNRRICAYGIIQPHEYKVNRIGNKLGEITFLNDFKYCRGFKFGGLGKVAFHFNYPYSIHVATQKQALIDFIKRDIQEDLTPMEDKVKSLKESMKDLKYSLQRVKAFEKE
jgi:hypothetical protein